MKRQCTPHFQSIVSFYLNDLKSCSLLEAFMLRCESRLMAIYSIILVLLLASLPVHAANEPALRLFPTTVVENLKQTGDAARSMEHSLQDVIKDFEIQMMLFNDSKCDGTEADEGCSEIVRQLGETYMTMLDKMEEQLPAMERSVKVTRDSLKKRIGSELGRKMSARQLQEMVRGKKRQETPASMPGRLRLSEKFKQYLKLVSMASRSGGGGSLAVVAAGMYMDTEEVLNLILLTRDEISRARLMTQLNQSYGALTPEMVSMVDGVKSILFGEEMDTMGQLPDAPRHNDPAHFVSPLEL